MIFDHFFNFLRNFFYRGFEIKIFIVMFYNFFKSKISQLFQLVKKNLYFHILMFVKGNLFWLMSNISFLGVYFIILVTMVAPHIKCSTRFFPLIISTQRPFWSKICCALGVLRYGLGQSSQDCQFWAIKFQFLALKYVHISSYFTHI